MEGFDLGGFNVRHHKHGHPDRHANVNRVTVVNVDVDKCIPYDYLAATNIFLKQEPVKNTSNKGPKQNRVIIIIIIICNSFSHSYKLTK